MTLAIVSQIGNAVPLKMGLAIGIVAVRRRCPLKTDVGQRRILKAQKAFEFRV